MAESSVESGKARPARWERDSTRHAILDAARRLAAHEGAEGVTLSRVAAEAGFAPPTVYAYFVSKDDLHLAVVADDLEKLACLMRGEEGGDGETASASEPERPESAAVIAFQRQPTTVEAQSDPGPAASPEADVMPAEDEGQDASLDASAPEADTTPAPHPAAVQVEAEVETATADGDDPGELEVVAGQAPAPEPDEAAVADAEISLAEIEQAIGIVLGPDGEDEDIAADAADDEPIPDAFPEEAVPVEHAPQASAAEDVALPVDEPTSEPVPAPDPVPREERRIERRSRARSGPGIEGRRQEDGPARTGLWRRSRQEDDASAKQMAMPLEQPEREAPQTAEAMAARIVQLEQTVARLESRPVDAWLERRLRVFERTLADIEARMEKSERDSATALSTVTEGYKALEQRFGGTLEDATRKAGESEQRHRAIASDLRMYVKDLSGRLGAVETALSQALDDGGEALSGSRDGYGGYHASTSEESEERDPAGDVRQPAGKDYLAAARQAANSAAADAERGRAGVLRFMSAPAGTGRGKPAVSRRTLNLLAGVLVLALLLIGAKLWLPGSAPSAPQPAASAARAPASVDDRVAALAKAGNAKAELVAALKLLNGDGTATDVPSAAVWLHRAALQHEPVAQYWLGTLYERGRGVAKDRAKAMQWYRQAAEAGNAKAMYRLGVGYAEGWNGQPDYGAAAKWFTKAADLGVIDAQFNLAVLYERGSGVTQSLVEAFKWYAIAAAQGDAESKSRIDSLATQMASGDVAKAQQMASSFTAGRPDPETNDEPDPDQVAQLQR